MSKTNQIQIKVHLYGALAEYGGPEATKHNAQLEIRLPTGSKISDLLNSMGIPPARKGLTFINGVLSDMPGLSADLETALQDGDRVGMFSIGYIWPFQYRHGARMTAELKKSLNDVEGDPVRHSYRKLK